MKRREGYPYREDREDREDREGRGELKRWGY